MKMQFEHISVLAAEVVDFAPQQLRQFWIALWAAAVTASVC